MKFSCIVLLLTLFCRQLKSHNVVHMEQAENSYYSLNKGQRQNARCFAFASYYSDHMVLQQAPQQAVIWGYYPDVGDRIIVKIDQLEKVYPADVLPGPTPDVGIWTVTLDPIANKGPYTIRAMADTSSIAIFDVLFGDVWVCSGQSNMQFTVSQMLNASDEINKASQYTNIRLFTVGLNYSATPLSDFDFVEEQWSLPSKISVGNTPWSYFSAVCWLYGKLLYEQLNYPIGLIDTTWGGTPVEAWSSPDALKRCGLAASTESYRLEKQRPLTRKRGPGSNSQLWNAMVNPLLRKTIYGVIWYQGESDAGEPMMDHYNCTFPSMIDDWREKFSAGSGQTSSTFPFGFVQLSSNVPDMTRIVGFPDIRWHQTADYGYVPNPRMPRVFMSVALDLPDFLSPWGSIHPQDKQDVAWRLSLSGLRVAYGRGPLVIYGPLPDMFVQQAETLVVKYGTDWLIRVANRQGFELCCTLGASGPCNSKSAWWLPTSILSNDTSSISLDASVCGIGHSIAAIRYAWRESPCVFKQCAVYAVENDLPAPPFISVKPDNSGADFTYVVDWSKPQPIP